MTGMEIGNYRILEKLGEGGMGVVYKALDTSLDRTVAVKVLNGDLARVPDLVARFRSEARAQANLNHTNLATLYTFLTVEGNSMMVMEFVDGETFAQMIRRRGPLPAEGCVPMFRQALLGFGYAHRAGIIHRDIKPSNIMLNRQGIVKVMDFGIAKVVGERGLTRTGMQVGTSRYMSPEQVLNKDADIRSDIYALGITLYEMLTANAPFQADSDFQVMSDHVHTPPPPPTRFYPYIPKGVENAVMKALAKNPDQRFQTVEEFGAALERPDDFRAPVLGSVVAPPPLPQQPPPPPPPPQAFTAPGQAAWPATVSMRGAGPAAGSVVGADPAPLQQVPPPYAPTVLHQTTPPPHYTPPPPLPPPARPPATGFGALFGTWPGRIVVAGIACVVLVMGGWLLLKPSPPRPLPSPAAPQASPSQVINPTPSAERVNIEMASGNAPSLQVQAFDASPNPVRPGERATLSWSVPGATEVNISPSVGSVAAQGSRVISPRTGEVFTLTAKGADGQTVSRTLNLMVAVNNSPPQQQQARDNGPPPQQQAPPERPPQQEQYQPAPPPQQEQYQPVAPPRQAPQQQTQASASPMMNVYHDHGLATGNQYTWPSCWGQLQIGGGKVVYHVLGTSDGRRDDFVAPVSAVDEVKVNRVPIRGRPAFHMRINGQNFNFVPASGAPIMFVNVINQWLAK